MIINHKNEYYLFVTNSAGWWHSMDLLDWNFVTPSQWPEEDMNAPVNYTDYKSNIFKSDSTVYTQFRIYSYSLDSSKSLAGT